MASLSGKTVLIIGASRGIGLELARQASAAGATVFGTVRSSIPAELSSLAKTTPISGVDVVKPESLKTLIEELKKNASHLDYVIFNAGVLAPEMTLDDVTMEGLLNDFTVNAAAPTIAIRELHKAGLLGGAGGASVVAIASSVLASIGLVGAPSKFYGGWGAYPYRGSKAAGNMFARLLNRDLGPDGVKVLSYHPGYVQTDMTEGTKAHLEPPQAADNIWSLLTAEDLEGGKLYQTSTHPEDYNGGKVIPW